jgi:hypothetical protein
LKVQKLIGTLAIFSVIIILSIGIIPPSSNNEAITTTYESNVNFDDYDDDDLIDYGYFDEIGLIDSELSIIETNRVFTESDQSLVDQFLDENDLPSSSEKLGIEVQTVLFDSDQKQYPSSSVIGIPELSVLDEQGRVLDLGTIQTSFLAITANTEKSFNLDGTVKFYLDDDLISTKRIYGSDTNTQNHELSIVDSLPNTSFDRPKAFTFTLSDEGRDWTHESEHTYRVVLTQINANVDSSKDFKQFSWTGENVVYELKIKVDETKKVILDETNSAIQIFKNDSTISLCGTTSFEPVHNRGTVRFSANPPSVIISQLESSGTGTLRHFEDYVVTKIIHNSSFEHEPNNPQLSQNNKTYLKNSCEVFTDIQRNTHLLFEINNNGVYDKIFVDTPKSQKNYYINAEFEKKPSAICDSPYNPVYTTYMCDIPVDVPIKITTNLPYYLMDKYPTQEDVPSSLDGNNFKSNCEPTSSISCLPKSQYKCNTLGQGSRGGTYTTCNWFQ